MWFKGINLLDSGGIVWLFCRRAVYLYTLPRKLHPSSSGKRNRQLVPQTPSSWRVLPRSNTNIAHLVLVPRTQALTSCNRNNQLSTHIVLPPSGGPQYYNRSSINALLRPSPAPCRIISKLVLLTLPVSHNSRHSPGAPMLLLPHDHPPPRKRPIATYLLYSHYVAPIALSQLTV